MFLYVLGAFLLAFLISVVFGKFYIPWLEKKNAWQPLHDKVAEQIYRDGREDSDPASR